MVDRATITSALGNANLPEFLDSGDSRVVYNWDFRLGLPSGFTQQGTGHTYDSTSGFKTDGTGAITYSNLVDTAIIDQGTILIEFQRAAMAFHYNSSTDSSFYDSVANPNATTQRLFNANEASGFAKEFMVYRNGAARQFQFLDEAATDDASQPIYYINTTPPDETFDSEWAILAITWKEGRIYCLIDGHVVASFGRRIVDGDLDDLQFGGRGTADYLNGYYIKRAQILNVCVAPKIAGPKIALIGDSFVARYTGRAAAAADTVAGYNEQQGGLAYAWAHPPVLTASRHTEQIAPNWGQSNSFHMLQAIATANYGIWPRIYNCGKNGYGWRSDLGSQFTAAQQAALVAYDPEILYCFGSVNDINLADTDDDIIGDIQGILTTVIGGCRNIRKVYFVETFSTPGFERDADLSATYAEDARLRAKFPQLHGFTVTNASGVDVSVEFVETWSQWAVDDLIPDNYCIATHPSNLESSKRTASVAGDKHLTAEGSRKVAEILKGRFIADLITRQ